MYPSYVFVSLLAVLQISGLGLGENVGSTLYRRGPCDEYCAQADAVAPGCQSASNPDQCFCTAENYDLLDACIACMVVTAEGRDAALGVIDGTDGTSAVLVEQKGVEVKDRMVKSCAAAGYPLDGSGGTVTTMGDVGTVTTMGGGSSGSVTTQGGSGSATSVSSASKGTTSTTASSAAATTSSGRNGASRVSSAGGGIAIAVGVAAALL